MAQQKADASIFLNSLLPDGVVVMISFKISRRLKSMNMSGKKHRLKLSFSLTSLADLQWQI